MKKAFLGFIVIGFIGMGIASHSMMYSHSDCLFGKLGPCTTDVLIMINAHFGAFQSLSAAIFSTLAVLTLAILLFLADYLSDYFGIAFSFKKFSFLIFPDSTDSLKERICGWLAMHENTPSFALARI